jgi:hypothetical protein
MARADAGAGDDPFVAGLDAARRQLLGELLVADALRR